MLTMAMSLKARYVVRATGLFVLIVALSSWGAGSVPIRVAAGDQPQSGNSGQIGPQSVRAPASAVVRVEAFGAKGDGTADDTVALRSAIDAASAGTEVRFESGKTYLARGNILVRRPGVKLVGYGATIEFVLSEADLGPKGKPQTSIQLLAPNTGVYGLTIKSNLQKRLRGSQDLCGIVLASEKTEAVDNHLEYIQVGIFARGAKNFLIANNTVTRTLADGIHITSGSWGGLITGNTVSETGDDMIAVVNYGAGEPTVGNVVIERNNLSGQYMGRGITVVGGRDITIRANTISDTTYGAGILIASESHYNTANVVNVLVEDNEIRNVQTTAPRYNPVGVRTKTGHAAIHVQADGDRQIRDLLFRRNHVYGASKHGITVRGDACRVGFVDNDLDNLGSTPFEITIKTVEDCFVSCSGNRSRSEAVQPQECQGAAPSVAGANH